MDRVALVGVVPARFRAADDAGLAACFHPAVEIYSEHAAALDPIVRGRDQLLAWAERVRGEWSEDSLVVSDVSEEGDGVVADVLITTIDGKTGWRYAVAVRFEDELIREVRPFWQRESAKGELRDLQ